MSNSALSGPRQIGAIGTAIRMCVGAGLLIFGIAGGPSLFEILAGFVLLPAAEMAIFLVVRPPGSTPLHIYGRLGYAVNFGTAGLLLAIWTTPAMLFYGASILLAVVKGYAGCEILALSNLLRRRDDQLACAVFSPIDAIEHPSHIRTCPRSPDRGCSIPAAAASCPGRTYPAMRSALPMACRCRRGAS